VDVDKLKACSSARTARCQRRLVTTVYKRRKTNTDEIRNLPCGRRTGPRGRRHGSRLAGDGPQYIGGRRRAGMTRRLGVPRPADTTDTGPRTGNATGDGTAGTAEAATTHQSAQQPDCWPRMRTEPHDAPLLLQHKI